MSANAYIVELARRPEYQGKTSAERAALANTRRNRRFDHELKNYREMVKCPRLGASLADRDAVISRFYAALYAAGMGWKVDQLAGDGWDFADPDMAASLDRLQAAGFPAEDIAALKAVGDWLESDYERNTTYGATATAEMFDEAAAELKKDAYLAHVNGRRNAALDAIQSGQVADLAALKAILGA